MTHDEQRRAGERLLSAIFNGALDAMLLADDQGRYVEANPAACELFGLSREQLLGRCVTDFSVPDYQVDAAWRTFVEDRRMRGRFSLRRPNGEIRLLDFSAVANVLPGLHLSILRDITERQRAEEELTAQLRASELRYRRIVESTSEGVWVIDAESRTTFVNGRMADMLGYSREAMLGHTPSALTAAPTAFLKPASASLFRGIADSTEYKLQTRDGRPLWVRATTNAILDEQGNYEGALSLITDVSERREAEQARNRLAAIVETSEDAIMSCDASGKIRTWNRGAEKLLQYAAHEAIGQPISRLFSNESAAELVTARKHGVALEPVTLSAVRRDGSLVEVSVKASPIEDSNHANSGVSVIARDLSEQRKAAAALEHTEAQLRQAQKMEAVGSLAGGLAHDFNNLLSVILSYTNMIIAGLPPDDCVRRDLQEVFNAGTRAAELTRQLLAFSRQQVLQPRVFDLNLVVRDLERMLARLLREDIKLTVLTSPELGKVHADRSQIEQVLVNLVVNARDAMPNGGAIAIETANTKLEDTSLAFELGVKPGDYVTVTVTDTGIGMEPAVRERVFDPFFTTKEQGKGTGLGLSMAYGIVQQSGGHISVESRKGVGSTFTIYLPRTDRAVDTAPAPLPQTTTLHGDESILLVEDEAQVRVLMRSILGKCGYNVLEAQSASEALKIGESYAGVIHLLLTDVVMPHMSGLELAERLAACRPEMSVLYMSGYTEDTIAEHGVLDSGVAFLQKPITPDKLVQKVREVLTADRRASLWVVRR